MIVVVYVLSCRSAFFNGIATDDTLNKSIVNISDIIKSIEAGSSFEKWLVDILCRVIINTIC